MTESKGMRGGDLTAGQLIVACRNIGYDLTCGQCASVFYTGAGIYPHDATCSTVGARPPQSWGVFNVTENRWAYARWGDEACARALAESWNTNEQARGGDRRWEARVSEST